MIKASLDHNVSIDEVNDLDLRLLKKGLDYKFCLFKVVEDLRVILFLAIDRHVDLADDYLNKNVDSVFIGAGFLKVINRIEIEVYWDSKTCRNHFGYDRPDENIKSEEYLLLIRSRFSDLLCEGGLFD